jgi:2-C-methyl-D-erythritol 4-phosphate cytidylyltransferase
MGGPRRKPFLTLAGKPILLHTLDRFAVFRERIVQTIVLLHPGDLDAVTAEFGAVLTEQYAVTDLVAGAERRQDTVRIGIERVLPEADLVAIHDGVRPFVSQTAVAAAFDAAARVGAAIVACPMKPTVKRVAGEHVVETIDRADLWGAQTPQVFRREVLQEAADAAEREGRVVTDDAQMVEHLGQPVAVVEGSALNLKITTPEDLRLAEALLAAGLVGS